jgi:hypothetical protein
MVRVGRNARKYLKLFIVSCSLSAIVFVVLLNPAVEEINLEQHQLNDDLKAAVVDRIESNRLSGFVNVFGDDAVLGERGEAVHLPDVYPIKVRKLIDQGWEQHEFNQYVSDLISVNRSLENFRFDGCTTKYASATSLQQTSVIITFHNEAWSTLLRTVHSVLNRGGKDVLEVILVDDFSDMGELKCIRGEQHLFAHFHPI